MAEANGCTRASFQPVHGTADIMQPGEMQASTTEMGAAVTAELDRLAA